MTNEGHLGAGRQRGSRLRLKRGATSKRPNQSDLTRAIRRAQTDPPLERLRVLYEIEEYTQHLLDEAVQLARDNGAKWEDIGEAFGGMTKQGAWDRWGKKMKSKKGGADK